MRKDAWVSIEDLGTIGRGKSKHRPRNDPSLFGGAYPFVQTGDIKAANFYLTTYSQTYNEKGLAQSKLWPKGTLCITIAANIGDTAILGLDSCFPDSIMGFVPKKGKSNIQFVKYCLDAHKKDIQTIAQGTTQDNLSAAKLRTVKFKPFSLSQQNTISGILFSYDTLIENNSHRIDILESMAENIYREWFVRLRFPGHEKTKVVKGVPEGWNIKSISSLGKTVTGKTPPTLEKKFYSGPYPFIKTPDMHDRMFLINTEETLSEEGLKFQKSQTIPENSICVSCIGTGGVVSLTAAISQTNQQIHSLIPREKEYREWGYFTLRGMKETIQLFGYTGATMTNLSKGKFDNLKCLVPSEEILIKFHKHTYNMFESIKTLQKLNSNLVTSRDRLLSRLMNGKIDVEKLDIKFPDSRAKEVVDA
jgi:type I restriction enzyme S subunit